MVTGSVHGDYSVLPPVRPFFVQFEHKLLNVEREHLLIGIGLRQAQIDVPKTVASTKHAYSRSHLERTDRIGPARILPFHSSEIRHAIKNKIS